MDQQTETRPAAASAEVDWTCPGALVTIEDLAERHKSSKRTKERDIQQGNLCARDPRILEVDQISMARGATGLLLRLVGGRLTRHCANVSLQRRVEHLGPP